MTTIVEGETYYIRISGYKGSTDDYTLVVSLAADVTKNGVVDFKELGTFVDSSLPESIPSDVAIRSEEFDSARKGLNLILAGASED